MVKTTHTHKLKRKIHCGLGKLFQIQVPKSFHWTLTHLHVPCGSLRSTTAELSSFHRAHWAHKHYLSSCHLQKRYPWATWIRPIPWSNFPRSITLMFHTNPLLKMKYLSVQIWMQLILYIFFSPSGIFKIVGDGRFNHCRTEFRFLKL